MWPFKKRKGMTVQEAIQRNSSLNEQLRTTILELDETITRAITQPGHRQPKEDDTQPSLQQGRLNE